MHEHDSGHHGEPDVETPAPDVVATLVENHRRFLSFLQKRVADRALAEEILQEAFVRSLEKVDDVRDSATAWFYRVLRNALVDHHRRAAVATKHLEAYGHEQSAVTAAEADRELSDVVCQCVGELAGTLKPEYATALRRIEIDGISVKDYAAEAGLSSNNAGVRIFRARDALRKQLARACGTCADHGCLDCTCESSRSAHSAEH